MDRFKELGIFENTPHKQPNHVLINEYKKGEGIMPHEDGNAYAEVVATVSLGAAICLEIGEKASENMTPENERTDDGKSDEETTTHHPNKSNYKLPTRIFQEPRSLLITTGPAYKGLLHGISSIDVDEDLNANTVANWSLLEDTAGFEKTGGRSERGTRVSLTYRDVLKVSSAASKVFGGLGRR